MARCLSAIESVSRTAKPVAEVGEVRCGGRREIEDLRAFLDSCVRQFGDQNVRYYVLRTEGKRYSYGFFVHPWVMHALRFIKNGGRSLRPSDRHWLQGLLFGYRPDAIQHFLRNAGSGRPKSM
jgi:hypothetical protein